MIERYLGIPRPKYDHGRSYNIFDRDESPKTAIETIIPVVSHSENIISFDDISIGRLIVYENSFVGQQNAMTFASNKNLPLGKVFLTQL